MPIKFGMAALATLSLNACFLSPNNFDATITLTQDGGYEFNYVGDMRYLIADEKFSEGPPKLQPFEPKAAVCSTYVNRSGKKRDERFYNRNYKAETIEADPAGRAGPKTAKEALETTEKLPRKINRQCTKEDLAQLKQDEDARFKRKKDRYEEMSAFSKAVFGGPVPGDDEALKAFAVKMKQYHGWQAVQYVGNNKFEVRYNSKGNFDSYFAFPIVPEAATQFPFFHILKRSSGDIEMASPAVNLLASSPLQKELLNDGLRADSPMDLEELAGKVTIITDGKVLANNSKDGFTEENGMKVMRWKVDGINDAPRALIRFKK